jgi:Amino acid permease
MQSLTSNAVIVMTFTASRVKQELAKEGILPWSLFFSTGRTTATSWLKARLRKSHYQAQPMSEKSANDSSHPLANPLEQSPMAALGLQWLSSLVLLAVTAPLTVNTQYSFITNLYTYTMVILVAFCTTTGLLYCKYIRRDWIGEYKPLGGPVAAVVFW